MLCTGLVLYSKANRRARESGPARAATRGAGGGALKVLVVVVDPTARCCARSRKGALGASQPRARECGLQLCATARESVRTMSHTTASRSSSSSLRITRGPCTHRYIYIRTKVRRYGALGLLLRERASRRAVSRADTRHRAGQGKAGASARCLAARLPGTRKLQLVGEHNPGAFAR